MLRFSIQKKKEKKTCCEYDIRHVSIPCNNFKSTDSVFIADDLFKTGGTVLFDPGNPDANNVERVKQEKMTCESKMTNHGSSNESTLPLYWSVSMFEGPAADEEDAIMMVKTRRVKNVSWGGEGVWVAKDGPG